MILILDHQTAYAYPAKQNPGGDGLRVDTPMSKLDFGQGVLRNFGITNVPELYSGSLYL